MNSYIDKKKSGEHVSDLLRPDRENSNWNHTYNDHNRMDDFKKIKEKFASKDDYDITFGDFLDEAQELAESWNSNDTEESNNEMSRKFFKKYAKFIVPVIIIGLMFTVVMICMVGFCCCGALACCIDGIQFLKDSEDPV